MTEQNRQLIAEELAGEIQHHLSPIVGRIRLHDQDPVTYPKPDWEAAVHKLASALESRLSVPVVDAEPLRLTTSNPDGSVLEEVIWDPNLAYKRGRAEATGGVDADTHEAADRSLYHAIESVIVDRWKILDVGLTDAVMDEIAAAGLLGNRDRDAEFPWAVENRVVKEPIYALFREREDAERFNEEMFDGRVIPNPYRAASS